MRQVRSTPFVRRGLAASLAVSICSLTAGALTGCGGGGHGFSVPSDPLVINTTSIPNGLSGQAVNIPIDFVGGAGGPYYLELISGTLPNGVTLNNNTVSLNGQLKEDGEFDFTIKFTDTGVNPFLTTTQHFHWSIGKGSLVFVTDANLPSRVYNQFQTDILELAGGTGPYKCEVVVTQPGDELLPTGLSIPIDSTQIYGASVGVKGTAPFVYTVRVRGSDSTVPFPLTIDKLFTITVLVPDVIITTTSLPNGTCGLGYSSKINTIDGIPPFKFQVVGSIGSTTGLVGELGTTGGVAKDTGLSAYPLDTAVGPTYPNKFPEGLYLRDSTGDLLGIGRRRGVFPTNFHVQSTVLPAVPGQNKWKALSLTLADSVPVNVALNNNDLLPGNVYGTANNIFQGPEKTKNYSKQFTALNGCPQDGKYDAPHESQVANHPGESLNRYDFSGTVFAAGSPPAGTTFSGTGLFSGIATATSQYTNVTIKAEDSQLPLPRSAAHVATGVARFEVGPDTVVITESSASATTQAMDQTMEYPSQTVEILEPFSSGPVVRALASSDMAATHTHPLGGTLSGSLSSIDFLRTSVNPTWWAYDGLGTNPLGARQMQHDDPQRRFRYDNFGSSYSYNTSTSNYYGYIVPSTYQEGREHAAEPAIEIPVTTKSNPALSLLAHSPSTGVYTDGGLLYAYDKSGEFGFFIVRKDGKIYIPWCSNKSTYTGLGDAWLVTGQTRGAQMRMPQITVSPDGRLAAAKVKVAVDNFTETAAAERVVVFSLTGEKRFNMGAGPNTSTFLLMGTGGSGNTTDGQYLYGSSLTLSNYSLYALRGNNYGTSNSTAGDRVVFGEHWVFRAPLFDAVATDAPATPTALNPSAMSLLALSGGTNVGGWTNVSGSPVSCCFQRWSSPGSSSALNYGVYPPYYSLNTGTGQYYDGQYSSLSSQTTAGTSVSSVSPCFFVYNWANFHEKAAAPHPFRVSRDGRACAIIGGANQSASVAPSTPVAGFLNRSVYVDFLHVFREAASAVRRYLPPSRTNGHTLGETYSQQYGHWNGPGSQFEISDDGTKIAAVYNASTANWGSHPLYARMGYGTYDYASREELTFLQGTAGGTDPWNSKSESLVTAGKTNASGIWRIGCLTFTRDATAIAFYLGCSPYYSTNPYYYYQYPNGMYGSIYCWTISSGALQSCLAGSDGGVSGDSGSAVTYSAGSLGSGIGTGSYFTTWGRIRPKLSFHSNDGNFMYICSQDALSNSDYTSGRLVGVNVSSSTTLFGRTFLRGFAPTWPTRYAFMTEAAYYYSYYQTQMLFGAGGAACTVGSHQCGANGIVYFASTRQGYNGGSNTYQSANSPGPYYYLGGQAGPTYYYSTYTTDQYGAQLYAMDVNRAGTPSEISSSVLAATGEYREISYIQPSTDGSRVAFVATLRNTGAYHQMNPGQERLYVITGTTSNGTTGAITGGSQLAIEATSGRVSASVALDTTGTRVYYAFSSNGNENGMVLVEKTLNTTGSAVLSTRTFNGVSNTAARFAVLMSGR